MLVEHDFIEIERVDKLVLLFSTVLSVEENGDHRSYFGRVIFPHVHDVHL